jgi:hypothetical protein
MMVPANETAPELRRRGGTVRFVQQPGPQGSGTVGYPVTPLETKDPGEKPGDDSAVEPQRRRHYRPPGNEGVTEREPEDAERHGGRDVAQLPLSFAFA